ncbi:MAG: T9SS type A sorting domain-containing protein [Flavobacteriales bacterium]
MLNRILIFIGIIGVCQEHFAQNFGFERDMQIQVDRAGEQLRNAWAGGMNAPQFSPIDINQDGLADIFVFEKTGNRISIFINESQAGQKVYRFAPEFAASFPELRFWALLRDFDNDGKPDIFSSAGNGIRIHKNISSQPPFNQFELINPLLTSNYNPFELNLFVSPVDLPAIDDIDGDGDLDILTFYILGTCVEYHRNLSVEQSGNTNELRFRLETLGWGNFTEDMLSNAVNLNSSCGGPGVDEEPVRHSGSTLCTFDANNDQMKDLLIGGIGYPVINFLLNGGTAQQANMISSTFDFPPSQPVHLQSFPGAYIFDVNNDGKRDLIVAPNTDVDAENKSGVHLYLNQGEDLIPDFRFTDQAFLQSEMLDFGEGAYPVFFDFDADGDLDLVVGNAGYYTPTELRGQIAVYRNIGNNISPSYRLITEDLANLSSLNMRYLFPTFGDLDGDGKADMLVGTLQGNILFLKNVATTGDAQFELHSQSFAGINSGTYSAPQLFDLDRDGLLDLIVGNRSGRLSFFPNTGNSAQAQFNTTADNDFLGGVRTVKVTESNFGYVTPCFIRMQDTTYLFCGSESGYIYGYSRIDDNINGSFTLFDSTLVGQRFGKMIGVAAADLNNDQMPEIIVGNAAGGLEFFRGIEPTAIFNVQQPTFTIYPNPAKDFVHIQFNQTYSSAQLELFDVSGRVLMRDQINNQQTGTITLPAGIAPGIYFLKLYHSSGTHAVQKLMIR